MEASSELMNNLYDAITTKVAKEFEPTKRNTAKIASIRTTEELLQYLPKDGIIKDGVVYVEESIIHQSCVGCEIPELHCLKHECPAFTIFKKWKGELNG